MSSTLAAISAALLAPFSFDEDPTRSTLDAAGGLWWADTHSDGLPDALAVAPDGTLRLWRSVGDGTFRDATEESGLSPESAPRAALLEDLDADGSADLLLADAGGALRLLRDSSSGACSPWCELGGPSTDPGVLGASSLDFDGDGRADLHLVTAGGHPLLRNVAHAVFEPVEFHAVRLEPANVGAVSVSASTSQEVTLRTTEAETSPAIQSAGPGAVALGAPASSRSNPSRVAFGSRTGRCSPPLSSRELPVRPVRPVPWARRVLLALPH